MCHFIIYLTPIPNIQGNSQKSALINSLGLIQFMYVSRLSSYDSWDRLQRSLASLKKVGEWTCTDKFSDHSNFALLFRKS